MSEKYNIPQPNSYDSMEGLEGNNDHKYSESVDMNEVDFQNFMEEKVLEPKLIINGLNSEGLVRKGHPMHIFFSDTGAEIEDIEHITSSDAPYLSHIASSKNELLISTINESLKGQVVVDLGAGGESVGYELAIRSGASAYVAVEGRGYYARNLAYEIAGKINERANMYLKENGADIYGKGGDLELTAIPFTIIVEDMLSFLKRIPDGSVSLICSGIDKDVISDDEYRKGVGKEVVRVMDEEGAYIGGVVGGHIDIDSAYSEQVSSIGVGDGFEKIKVYTKI